MAANTKSDTMQLIEEWTLSTATTLGSSVRSRGILLETRARLPLSARKALDIVASQLTLIMPVSAVVEFREAAGIVARTLEGIEALPVIPREIEDILAISTTERHRWLKDGRLPSGGIRTVRLRGRAREITFHVFDPRMVEDVLDRELVGSWREEDAVVAADNRRRAAWKAKVTRSLKNGEKEPAVVEDQSTKKTRPNLSGWEEFNRDGLLR
jgi:hypothetical protein